MYYIGIDLGTSSVKMILCDKDGNVKKIVCSEYPIFFPKDGYSEQNPSDWYEKTLEGLKELVSGEEEKIAGIGIAGQMHGLVALDENDNVIRPAILWNDSRASCYADYLNNVIGKDKLLEYTANIAFAGFTAPKILWLKENEPENFSRINKIMLPKDYLVYMLSGTFSTDVSDASGMLLMNVKKRCWSKEMLDICGIEEKMLPKIFESYEVVGVLKKEISEKIGINHQVKIVAGAGDNAAASVGMNVLGDLGCNISLGTSGTVFISSKSFKKTENGELHSFAHSDGNYHLMGCMLSAASCNKWWCAEILNASDYENEQDFEKNLGLNDVFFLPYLTGERSPHNDPKARAVFFGMSADTKRRDMTQAVLEGVAFGIKDSLEIAKNIGIKIEKSKICGGGAKSGIWKKIMCNVLNVTLECAKCSEGPSFGAALLSMVGCGEYKTVGEAAEKTVQISEKISPNADLVLKYEKKYEKFKEIYPVVKVLYDINVK